MAPLVSVLMPVRDGVRWLTEAIGSIRAQTLTDCELIAVDDGSLDETPRILEQAARQDQRIRVIRLERVGLVAALNKALAASQGRFIARLDSDDRALPERLRSQVDYLTAHPDTGLLGTWAEIIDDAGELIGRLEPPTSPESLAAMLVRQNPFIHPSIMFPKAVLEKTGVYRPAFEAAEDYDLWLRIAEIAKVANLPKYLTQYRKHGAGVTSRSRLRQLFSVRLAQLAALARRAGEDDAISASDKPPDWRGPEFCRPKLYRDAASLFRFIDLATDPNTPESERENLDISVLNQNTIMLSHAERHIAQIALLHLLKRGGRLRTAGRADLLWQFIRLHPSRALKLGYDVFKNRGDF